MNPYWRIVLAYIAVVVSLAFVVQLAEVAYR